MKRVFYLGVLVFLAAACGPAEFECPESGLASTQATAQANETDGTTSSGRTVVQHESICSVAPSEGQGGGCEENLLDPDSTCND